MCMQAAEGMSDGFVLSGPDDGSFLQCHTSKHVNKVMA